MEGPRAESSHAGIPWLKWFRDQASDRLHFWPFDGWVPAADKSVIVEVYPSIFRHRFGRDSRTADEQDAYATARWMADMAAREALADCFSPPLIDTEKAVAAIGLPMGLRFASDHAANLITRSFLRCASACQRSCCSWEFSQVSADVLNAIESRTAISGVMRAQLTARATR